MENGPVYMDYNATTPLAPEVVRAVADGLLVWGNPSSGYKTGQLAKAAVEQARCQVAAMLGAQPEEIIFTSGGTESNHLAIWSAIQHFRRVVGPEELPHVVTSNIEHCALEAPLRKLEEEGLVRVSYVPVVRGAGRLSVPEVLSAVTPNTCLISIMLANNETGILQPVEEIFRDIKMNPPRSRGPILLHTDAAQAIGKLHVNVNQLQADLLTVVGHKFYGPRIGALYHRQGWPAATLLVAPLFFGGGQERRLRPGTENTPMIVGLGAAALLVSDNLDAFRTHMKEMRDYLRDEMIKNFELIVAEEPTNLRLGQVCWRYVDRYVLPNTLSLRIGGIQGNQLLKLCQDDFEASTGAACHTGGSVSQVLLNSWTWGRDGASETIRLSVGRETTKEEIDRVVEAIRRAVQHTLESSGDIA